MKIVIDNKTIGEINNRTFYKVVSKSKHLFKVLDAWGIDAETFNNTIVRECDIINIFDKEEKKVYTVSVSDFDKKAIYKHFKPHRSQRFLPLADWMVVCHGKES